MILIFLGAPGSGKGTHSKIVKEKLEIVSISTGDMIRSALKKNDEISKKLKEYTESGSLIPDDMVIEIIKSRISESDCKNGFILDGFPRTIVQAESIEKMGIVIDKVINIDVKDEIIYNRLSGRKVCSNCGAVFNDSTEMKPKIEDVCDLCNCVLEKRKDDSENVIKQRLEVYYNLTVPLIGYYKNKGKLLTIDGSLPLKEASENILNAVMS